MSTPFLGEIRMVSWNFPPKGWALCNGQLLPINTNQALFSILGTTYGGNGQTNFALPDLRGRIPMHWSNNTALGQAQGTETVTLYSTQIPAHSHGVVGMGAAGSSASPSNALPAQAKLHGTTTGVNDYAPASGSVTPMAPLSIGLTGGAQAHANIPPYLCLNFAIALVGIYPSRN